ncbi:hypothetical protein QEZ48_14865 [Aquamicrobium lusatiense]|uniref:hypothetical protein n=1 Tax=Aquamicrobium lusatiense TaxID=89772 RepID=UPI0024537793|nr:hypothetical protein [Aquamicrobium lusatiense]MDH4992099.1 hypothetical protein [Aquamicrobium lusatiense]
MSNSTTLVVSTPEAFANQPAPAELGHIETLHIGARCFGLIPRDQLFAWVAHLSSLQYIHLADDWIPDNQMASIAEEFTASFPNVKFIWSYEGLAGGKHGR